MDLCCNKNAYMLFRISKVFHQGDLNSVLKTVDIVTNNSESMKASPRMSHTDMSSLIGYTHQNPLEIYGSEGLFDSIFDNEFKSVIVERLINSFIFNAFTDLKKLEISLNEKFKKQQFNFFKMIFGSDNGSHDNSLDEVDIDETRKSIGYLENVVHQFVNIFDLDSSYVDKLNELQQNQTSPNLLNTTPT